MQEVRFYRNMDHMSNLVITSGQLPKLTHNKKVEGRRIEDKKCHKKCGFRETKTGESE